MLSADAKANVKQDIKKLVTVFYTFLQEILLVLEMQCNKGMYFPFNFAWYSVELDIFC